MSRLPTEVPRYPAVATALRARILLLRRTVTVRAVAECERLTKSTVHPVKKDFPQPHSTSGPILQPFETCSTVWDALKEGAIVSVDLGFENTVNRCLERRGKPNFSLKNTFLDLFLKNSAVPRTISPFHFKCINFRNEMKCEMFWRVMCWPEPSDGRKNPPQQAPGVCVWRP